MAINTSWQNIICFIEFLRKFNIKEMIDTEEYDFLINAFSASILLTDFSGIRCRYIIYTSNSTKPERLIATNLSFSWSHWTVFWVITSIVSNSIFQVYHHTVYAQTAGILCNAVEIWYFNAANIFSL